MRTVGRDLDLVHFIRAVLPALGRGVVDGRRALGTAPAALANEESTADHAGVDLAALLVDQESLAINDGSWLALVVHTEDLLAELELPAFG